MKRIVLAAMLSASVAHAEDDEPKSQNLALGLSASAGVVLPIAFLTGAFVANTPVSGLRASGVLLGGAIVTAALGPTLGHWYAGEYVSTGLWIRLAGGAILAITASASCGGLGCESSASAGLALGAVTIGVGTIVDIATARWAVRSYNTRHVMIVPTLTSQRGPALGLGVVGSF